MQEKQLELENWQEDLNYPYVNLSDIYVHLQKTIYELEHTLVRLFFKDGRTDFAQRITMMYYNINCHENRQDIGRQSNQLPVCWR